MSKTNKAATDAGDGKAERHSGSGVWSPRDSSTLIPPIASQQMTEIMIDTMTAVIRPILVSHS